MSKIKAKGANKTESARKRNIQIFNSWIKHCRGQCQLNNDNSVMIGGVLHRITCNNMDEFIALDTRSQCNILCAYLRCYRKEAHMKKYPLRVLVCIHTYSIYVHHSLV